MALGSGLAAQIGYGVEVTPGTVVTPTIFIPLVSESLTEDRENLESAGIIAGRRILDTDMWNGGPITLGGGVQHELYDRGIGTLFKKIFGANSTTGAGPYTHTITPGDLADDSMTIQKGVPDVDGTVHPLTFGGAKVAIAEFACGPGAIATMGITWVASNAQTGSRTVTDGATTNTDTTVTSDTAVFTAADVGLSISGTGIPAGATIASVTNGTTVEISAAATATATGLTVVIGKALATASYASGAKPVKFNHAAVSIGGSSVPAQAFTLTVDNGLAVDRRKLGSRYIMTPIEAALRSITGTIDVEFNNLTQYRRYLAGDTFAIVIALTVGTYSITFTMNARYEPGQTPQVSGAEIVKQSLPFKCVGDTDAEACTVVVVNGDATI